jgi:hypothetical protein
MSNKEVCVLESDHNVCKKIADMLNFTKQFDKIHVFSNKNEFVKKTKDLGSDLAGIFVHNDGDSFDFLKLSNNDIKIVFFHDETDSLKEKYPNIIFMNLPFKVIEFGDRIKEFFSVEGSSHSEVDSKWFPFTIKKIKLLGIVPCDVYIRLSGDKYLKVCNKGDLLDDRRLQKYIDKGMEYFYIDMEEYYENQDAFYPKDIANPEKFSSTDEHATKSHEALHELISDFGITESVLKSTEQNIEDVAKGLEGTAVDGLLEKFKNSPDTFIYDHSYLTTIFVVALSQELDWGSEKITAKLCFASMFHDLGIEDPKMAFLEGNPKELLMKQKKPERDMILDHPKIITEKLSQISSVEGDVLNIIQNHHEGSSETGYPKGTSGINISQLTCAFILAHEFVLALYRVGFNLSKLDIILEKVSTKFSSGNFKALLEPFKTAVKKNISGIQ